MAITPQQVLQATVSRPVSFYEFEHFIDDQLIMAIGMPSLVLTLTHSPDTNMPITPEVAEMLERMYRSAGWNVSQRGTGVSHIFHFKWKP